MKDDKMIEIEEKYRQYVIARMQECIEDAKKIFENEFRDGSNPEIDRIAVILIANSIFEKRITPFHYWRDKKLAEAIK